MRFAVNICVPLSAAPMTCTPVQSYTYSGSGSIVDNSLDIPSVAECCKLCEVTEQCWSYVWDEVSRNCDLYSSLNDWASPGSSDLFSGNRDGSQPFSLLEVRERDFDRDSSLMQLEVGMSHILLLFIVTTRREGCNYKFTFFYRKHGA